MTRARVIPLHPTEVACGPDHPGKARVMNSHSLSDDSHGNAKPASLAGVATPWTCALLLTFTMLPAWVHKATADTALSPEPFASLTNCAFVGSAMLVAVLSFRSTVDPRVYAACINMALLGGASLGHHRDPTLGTPEHRLDVRMGWVSWLYLAYVALLGMWTLMTHVCARLRLKHDVVRLILTLAALTALAVIASNYNQARAAQNTIYLTSGVILLCGTCVNRVLALKLRGSRLLCAVSVALLELATLGAMLGVSGLFQGQLFSDFQRSTMGGERYERYNIGHGQWHLLQAMLQQTVVLYAADALHPRGPGAFDGEVSCRFGLPAEEVVALATIWLFLLVGAVVYAASSVGAFTATTLAMNLGMMVVAAALLWRRAASRTTNTVQVPHDADMA